MPLQWERWCLSRSRVVQPGYHVPGLVQSHDDLGHSNLQRIGEVDGAPVIKVKKRFARPVSEAAQLLDACRGSRPCDLRDFAMFTLGFRTGSAVSRWLRFGSKTSTGARSPS